RSGLPDESDFKALSHLDGLLIDSHLPFDIQRQFQDRIFSMHEDILPVNFADTRLQVRWMQITGPEKYNIPFLQRLFGLRSCMGC
ncbi:MAG: hypothetical protein WC836_17220, partial [Desulfobacula sp.]